MSSNLEKLTDLIKNSELNPKEQTEFLNLLAKAPDQDLNEIIEIFTNEPVWIRKVFDNYQKKRKALTENNRTAWQEIINQECRDLEDV